MIREDLIESAVSFLQDPGVAASPIERRISFLQSKNLTSEEIAEALARTGEDPSTIPPPTDASSTSSASGNAYQNQQVIRRQQPPPQWGHGGYPNGFWQPPPPEVPRRDWRDWFIMATVMGGVSYGLYVIAKRYIYPLIAPPTPPQLEQDKASIDASFEKAFALLDQLGSDTEALKAAEQARTDRLDSALSEVETVISELKAASRRREDEGDRINREVKSLRTMIPKAMEAQKVNTDTRLQELSTELMSLKTLIGNRLGGSSVGAKSPGVNMFGPQGTASVNGSGFNTPGQATPSVSAGGVSSVQGTGGSSISQPAAPAAATKPESSSPFPLGSLGAKASIPAWQMAAANKNKPATDTPVNGTESNTPDEASGSS
ncbi:hypothetical protein L228DRAFT_246797 [Xylona heveae TC161]|uniref:Peroxisomal membrane protein PEX14 n=1 Tax=Xylona heveae (strain CBS 132557 / TC161) TaxID=1328760 RepID=A0A165GRA5_XYLHT|nr:hypothetical protein L228DRAFT_246797 [Xylona heveae TC161]KZF22495.1 hypothetical protein L228DRAFT_246797 [Xylona heveae TC161]